MPRFFFDVCDSVNVIDDVGTELPDVEAARLHATKLAGELIAKLTGDFWSSKDWQLEARDEHGLILFCLSLMANDAPVLHGMI